MNLKKTSWVKIISKLIIEKPWYFITLSLVFLSFLFYQVQFLKSDYSVRIWFKKSDPLIKELDHFEKTFGSDEKIVIGAYFKDEVFTKKNIDLIKRVTNDLWQVPHVYRVDSLSNTQFPEVIDDDINVTSFLETENLKKKKKIALSEPIFLNRLINKKGNLALFYLTLEPAFKKEPNYSLITSQTKEILKKYKQNDVSFYLSGTVVNNAAFKKISESDIEKLVPLIFISMMLIQFLIFKTIESIFIPFFFFIGTIIATYGFSAICGIPFENLTSSIPGILMSICIADIIHILSGYYLYLQKDPNKSKAAVYTLEKNLIPTFLTSFSTAISFLSLSTTDLLPTQHLGYLASFGTMLAWALTIFFICPVLPMIPNIKINILNIKIPKPTSSEYLSFLIKNKLKIISIFSLLSVIALYIGSLNIVNSNPIQYFSKHLEVRKHFDFLNNNFGGITGPEVFIDSGLNGGAKSPNFLKKVEQFKFYIESQTYINKVTSLTNTIKILNQKLNQDNKNFYQIPKTQDEVASILFFYTLSLPPGLGIDQQMSLNERFYRLNILWNLTDSRKALGAIDKIKAKAQELDLDAKVTGKMPLFYRMTNYIVSSFFTSISVALIVISLFLFLILRSASLGFYSIIANFIPISFGLALMTILSKSIDISTSIQISICLGVAVDDTVHFLSNYKKFKLLGYSNNEAVEQTLNSIGGALTYTTLILIIGFLFFLAGDFTPNQNLGMIVPFVLLSALILDFMLLPALLVKKEAK